MKRRGGRRRGTGAVTGGVAPEPSVPLLLVFQVDSLPPPGLQDLALRAIRLAVRPRRPGCIRRRHLLAIAQKPSAFGSVWEKVIGSGGLGPIIQGVGAGLSRAGLIRRPFTERAGQAPGTATTSTTLTIKPMFRQPWIDVILADSFAAQE